MKNRLLSILFVLLAGTGAVFAQSEVTPPAFNGAVIRVFMTRMAATVEKIAIEQQIPSERCFSDPLSMLTMGTDASFYRLLPKLVVRVESEAEVAFILQQASAQLEKPARLRTLRRDIARIETRISQLRRKAA
mgnify:CR=1 FL=1